MGWNGCMQVCWRGLHLHSSGFWMAINDDDDKMFYLFICESKMLSILSAHGSRLHPNTGMERKEEENYKK